MKAVVMAGGAGSRLRPLTIARPKPMVPMVNKPVIAHILDLLKRHGITDVVLTVYYMAETIEDYFGDGQSLGMNIQYSIEETPLGTAGSVKQAQELLDDTFIIISGDAITDFDLTAIVDYHKAQEAMATLTLYRVANPLEYGVVIIGDQGHPGQGRIQRFLEKPSWGEVISDTVNTGIYVLEPEALDYFEAGISYDFSRDLFPTLLKNDDPMFGFVAGGYWCDVGNLSEYIRATGDILGGNVKMDPPGPRVREGLWAGEGVDIDPGAQLYGPIYLGAGVKIRDGVIVHGPSVIGDYSVVDRYAHVERSVVLRNCYIGESVELRGALVGQQCSLKQKSIVFEGGVIGDSSIIGERAIIHPSVKIWPRKDIEAGATVNSSIIWGSQGRHVLFGRYGVTGLVNIDLTPEVASRLGAAFGATLPKGATVTINRDENSSSRMLKRGVISGLPSSGVNVVDLRYMPVPVARFMTRTTDAAGGVHVRLSPYDSRVVDIKFFDADGQDLSKNDERNIERVYFREDFRRVYLDEVGSISYAAAVIERYSEAFLGALDVEAIRAASPYLAVDFANAPTSLVLAPILTKLNCRVAALNQAIEPTKMSIPAAELQEALKQLASISQVLHTTLGVRLDVAGERVFVVDCEGEIVSGTDLCAALAILALESKGGGTIAVPVSMPNVFESIAETYGGKVVRTQANMQALTEAAERPDVLLAGNDNGAIIWPDLQPAVDGMMTVAKLLELMAIQNTDLCAAIEAVPEYHMARSEVDCPWESKGAVMRMLNQQYKERLGPQIDGVRIELGGPDEWVLVLPDADNPVFHLFAQASSDEQAREFVGRYERIVDGLRSSESKRGS